jgi:cytochrome b561
MQIKNTATSYGSIAKYIHWITAACFLLAYLSIYYREWFAKGDLQNATAIQLHFSAGISIAAITALRIVWCFVNTRPIVKTNSKYKQLAVRIGHSILYVVMIIMPISGYFSIAAFLSTGTGYVDYFLLYELPIFKSAQAVESIGFTLKQFEEPASIIHGYLGAWLVWVLILGHVSAALYHHFVIKDQTLHKMTFG